MTAFLLSGCSDFLEVKPVSQTTTEEYFKTAKAKDAEALLSGAYEGFYNEYYVFDFLTNGDVTADNCYAGGDNAANFQIDQFTVNSTNGNVTRDWRYLYNIIKNCNFVIQNVPHIEDPELDNGNRRNQILGEARFIRALNYFNLVRLWGGVPLVLTVGNNLEDMQIERSPVEEVYQQIIEDLNFAVENVAETADNKGIVTTGAVNTLLAKVYASKPGPEWDQVNRYCDAVIAGGYDLLPNYANLFNINNKNNQESIFEIQYDGESRSNWLVYVIKGSGWKKFCTPANDLVRAFDEEGDNIRKNASILFLDQTAEGWSDRYWSKANYPFINKYPDETGRSNIYVFRLADVLLLKAEALNETGDVPGAAKLVNRVRARADLLPVTAADQAGMRLAIEKERRLELAFEGHRWFDLLRTGRAIPVMEAVKDGEGSNLDYPITENKLIWPVPQTELDRNEGVTQNPGF